MCFSFWFINLSFSFKGAKSIIIKFAHDMLYAIFLKAYVIDLLDDAFNFEVKICAILSSIFICFFIQVHFPASVIC